MNLTNYFFQVKMSKYELHTSLYSPHQEDGVKWMNQMENQLNGPKGGFLCDEMGLGKTILMLGAIMVNVKASRKRTLIVLPYSLLQQWNGVFEKFLGHSALIFHHLN